jgi:nicotinamide-nucleotide adenylyltransferase
LLRQPGLFIGRFQPLHNGHVHALKQVFKEEEQVFIVIGSAQASYTPSNPFTTAERIRMLKAVLNDLGIPCSRYQIIPIPDIDNFRYWVTHIKQYVPPFGVVYSGSKTGQALFSEEDYPVRKIRLLQKKKYSGTIIRRRWVQGEEWEGLVPDVVVKLIQQFEGVQRVKSLFY